MWVLLKITWFFCVITRLWGHRCCYSLADWILNPLICIRSFKWWMLEGVLEERILRLQDIRSFVQVHEGLDFLVVRPSPRRSRYLCRSAKSPRVSTSLSFGQLSEDFDHSVVRPRPVPVHYPNLSRDQHRQPPVFWPCYCKSQNSYPRLITKTQWCTLALSFWVKWWAA